MHAWRHARTTGSRGQSLVETALVLPILLLLMLGLLDLGRGAYAYVAIGDAARAGTRTAIVNQYEAAIRQRAGDQATSLDIDTATATSNTSCPKSSGGLPNLMTPLGATGVCVQYLDTLGEDVCASGAGVECVAVVTVKYTFTPMTPLIGLITGPIRLVQRAQQPVESVCTSATCPVP